MISNDETKNLREALSSIPDPRKERGVRYKYCDLILLIIYAILSGFSTGVDIEFYVEENFEYFQKMIGLKNVPSHDTFSRIMRITNFDNLASVLSTWLVKYYPETYKKYQEKKVLHLDGKAICAASEKSKGEEPIYLLNAMYEGGSISVYSKRVGEKTNEIGELPTFLNQFNLEETIVTIDAIGTNENIIKAIIDKKGHYLLQVKDNQSNLKIEIEKEIENLKLKNEYEKLETAQLELTGHGRHEIIKTTLIKNTQFIFEKLGLKSFYGTIAHVAVFDKTTEKLVDGHNQTTNTRALLITNLEGLSAENIQSIKLSHWNIEAQHWILDVQLNEDLNTARRDNSIENASAIKKFCLWIKKQDKEIDQSKINVKRFAYKNTMNIERISKLLFMDIAKA